MTIEYRKEKLLDADEFRAVLQASGLAQRRPVDHPETVEGMVRHADLTVTAREDSKLIGVARSVTDFHYCCYLSDLAVDITHQRRGIGRELIRRTREALGPRCALILLSAPAAVDYYVRVGFEHHPQAWVLPPDAPR